MKGKRREGKDEGSGKWSAPGPALALDGPADTAGPWLRDLWYWVDDCVLPMIRRFARAYS